MGVSMSASLIKVNESNLSYALVFLPRLDTAAFAKELRPIAGPILPIPTQRPLAIRRRLSLIVVAASDCPWIKRETKNAEIIGVCISTCVISIKPEMRCAKNGCRATAWHAACAGTAEASPMTRPVMPIAKAIPSSA